MEHDGCFMSEVKRVSIEKVCCKSKIKYWDYMSAINILDNIHNDFNIKYMDNNKGYNKPHRKHFTIACHLQIYIRTQRMHSQNKINKNP